MPNLTVQPRWCLKRVSSHVLVRIMLVCFISMHHQYIFLRFAGTFAKPKILCKRAFREIVGNPTRLQAGRVRKSVQLSQSRSLRPWTSEFFQRWMRCSCSRTQRQYPGIWLNFLRHLPHPGLPSMNCARA